MALLQKLGKNVTIPEKSQQRSERRGQTYTFHIPTSLFASAALLCQECRCDPAILPGYDKFRGITLGCADIDWVYNSMPPKQSRIYPQEGMKPVTSF